MKRLTQWASSLWDLIFDSMVMGPWITFTESPVLLILAVFVYASGIYVLAFVNTLPVSVAFCMVYAMHVCVCLLLFWEKDMEKRIRDKQIAQRKGCRGDTDTLSAN